MREISDREAEEKLREFFEANYEYLKETSGHSINEMMRERAFEQVLMYWKKHKDIMLDGDVTSVNFSLSNQKTPNQGIPFSVEGMLNVLEKDGRKSLFEVTTNSREEIEGSIDDYKDELNLFAYELEKTQGQKIDETFVLSTSVPKDVKYALKTKDIPQLKEALEKWNPVVSVQHDALAQENALRKVGEVVEKINACQFDPPPPSALNKKFQDGKPFYTHVCQNCDLRKSCESFRGM